MIPQKMFFTKGVGSHRDKLTSFEAALRKAHIEKYNIVQVSSIFPPGCRMITREEGTSLLKPGQIVHAVLAVNQTNEAGRRLTAAIGLAIPSGKEGYGYLSEHHAFGESAKQSKDYAEDLAATMLATTLGIELDSDTAWDERKQVYEASGRIFKTHAVCQAAEGEKGNRWTSAIAAAVFV